MLLLVHLSEIYACAVYENNISLDPNVIVSISIAVRNNSRTEEPDKDAPTDIENLQSSDDCLDQVDGTILSDSRHCRRFYVCQNQRVTRFRCSIGQWFDRETRTCQDRSLVANCPANKE